MPTLYTNRDLYLAIEELSKAQDSSERTLEEYLRSMLGLATQYENRESLTLLEFYDLLASAFTQEPIPFDEQWRREYARLALDQSTYNGWRATALRQIVDLREMAEVGILNDPYAYFGIDVPRGPRWYNVHPLGYLECGMTGSLGGWEPDGESGRQFVPGQVAVVEDDGTMGLRVPEEIKRPIVALPIVGWDDFSLFVNCGGAYE